MTTDEKKLQAMLQEAYGDHIDAQQRHNEGISMAQMDAWKEDIRKAHANWQPPTPTTEDRLKGAIIEALRYLDKGASGRAHEVLRKALTL